MATDTARVTATSSVSFDIENEVELEKMLEYLNTHGYAVVKGVASPEDIAKAKDNFWTFWEKEQFRGPLDRNDMSTWSNWMANSATGILATSRQANHNDFLWETRLLPTVRRVFASIWDSNDLIVSYDAGGVFRPWKYNIRWLTNGGWWHVDQNAARGPHRQGRVTVQGLVTYYDATAETGGLCVIPGSHLQHNEVCERAPMARAQVDFLMIPADEPVLRSAEPTLICAKAGDLILWDSRTVHCNTPALHMAAYHANLLNKGAAAKVVDEPLPPPGQAAELLRLVAYVCMVPASHASPDIMRQRKDAFMHRLPSSHYPTHDLGLPQLDRIAPWTTRREILELVGYTEGEIQNLQRGWPAEGQPGPSPFERVVQVVTVCAVLYILFG